MKTLAGRGRTGTGGQKDCEDMGVLLMRTIRRIVCHGLSLKGRSSLSRGACGG
jgi:hypothetical protein